MMSTDPLTPVNGALNFRASPVPIARAENSADACDISAGVSSELRWYSALLQQVTCMRVELWAE